MSCDPSYFGYYPDGYWPSAPIAGVACPDDGIPISTLQEIAESAQEMTVDGMTVKERMASDLIALDKYLSGKRVQCATGGNGWGALGIARAIPPDANRGGC